MNQNGSKIIKNEHNTPQNHFGQSMNRFMPIYIPPSNQIGLYQNQGNNQIIPQNRQLYNNNNNNQQHPRQNEVQYINNNQIREPLAQPQPLVRSLSSHPPLPLFIPPSPTLSNISNNNIDQVPRYIPQRPPSFDLNIRPPINIPPAHFENSLTKMLEEIELTSEVLDKNQEKECVICLEEFSPGDIVSYLPCFHLYHYTCIKSWVEHKTKCPLCNTVIKFE